jgi:transcriptional regulator with XRE-family HTH domain
MSKQAFGLVIKELRIEKNITQEKLAELAEVDRTYIYRIEHGLREPSFTIFLKLIEGLKISADEFMARYKKELKNEKIGKIKK